VFGANSIFEMDFIRAFRKIFRFSMNGFLPDYPMFRKFDYSDDELLNLPHPRFVFILENIKKWNLQEAFLKDPSKIINDIAKQVFPNWEKKFKKFKKKLRKVANRPRRIQSNYAGPLEIDIMKHILNLYELASKSDPNIVDRYLDILWTTENGPPLIEAPIQIYGLEEGGPFCIKTSDEYGDSSVWLSLFILESLVFQFLYRSKIYCPFSKISSDCKQSYQSDVLLHCCDETDCIIKTIAKYIGLLEN
jgi:hypothetical protein